MGTVLATRGLNLPAHDYILASPTAPPTDGNQVFSFYRGGPSGELVSTLTVTYVGGNFQSALRT